MLTVAQIKEGCLQNACPHLKKLHATPLRISMEPSKPYRGISKSGENDRSPTIGVQQPCAASHCNSLSQIPGAAPERETRAELHFLAGSQQGMRECSLQTIPYGFLQGNSLGSFPTPGRSFPTEHQQVVAGNEGCTGGELTTHCAGDTRSATPAEG